MKKVEAAVANKDKAAAEVALKDAVSTISKATSKADIISHLVPVWWEFHTVFDGVEQLNDFSFEELDAWI